MNNNIDYVEAVRNIKKKALENDVPIMQDDGVDFITRFITDNNINSCLELGTAVGYSAIMMALTNPNMNITTIERDEERYLEAVKNVKKLGLEKQITLIFNDISDVNINGNFDMIFIDAAKSQNIKFFEKFENNLSDKGFIITDNIYFHGLVDKDPSEIESRNLRQLVRKIKNYIEFLNTNQKYDTEILRLGDGISISKRKEENR